jgi:hypothetical protein
VRVNVYESGSYYLPASINHLLGLAHVYMPDARDSPILYAYIGAKPGITRSINYAAISYDYILKSLARSLAVERV